MSLRLDPARHYVLLASAGPGEQFAPEDFPGIMVEMDALLADLADLPEDDK